MEECADTTIFTWLPGIFYRGRKKLVVADGYSSRRIHELGE